MAERRERPRRGAGETRARVPSASSGTGKPEGQQGVGIRSNNVSIATGCGIPLVTGAKARVLRGGYSQVSAKGTHRELAVARTRRLSRNKARIFIGLNMLRPALPCKTCRVKGRVAH